jgi:hypothetical protein
MGITYKRREKKEIRKDKFIMKVLICEARNRCGHRGCIHIKNQMI